MAQKLVKFITQEEFEKIFEATKDKKLKLAMLLGFEGGMRISEIVGLHAFGSRCCKTTAIKTKEPRSLDGKKVVAYTCSKCGRKLTSMKDMARNASYGWEVEPLTKDRVEVAMIRILGGKGEKDRVVPRPKRMNDKAVELLPLKLSRRTLQRHVENIGKKLLGREISFHTLRHGFGSHLAGQGRPLHEIQMLMGHSRLDTTGIYLHANPKQAIEAARSVF